MKLFIPGGAGLVGLNLIHQIQKDYPDWELIVFDKKLQSIEIAKKLFSNSNVSFVCEDLNMIKNTKWPSLIQNCDACVMLQAEIGNTDINQFWYNNVETTITIIEELKKKPYVTVAHITTGKYNIFCKIRAKGTEHAREIIFSIDDVEGVLRTETMISLEESINDKKRLMKNIFQEL